MNFATFLREKGLGKRSCCNGSTKKIPSPTKYKFALFEN